MPQNSADSTRILLLPGLLCDHTIWAAQIAVLGADRCVSITDFYDEADTIEQMAEHALAQVQGSFSLAGHSMGARVALEIVRRVPERVERIALISTGVHLPRAGEAKARHALLSLGLELGVDAMLDAWLPPMVWEENQTRPGLMDRLRAMCERAGIDSFERQIRALLHRPEVESLLPQIGCPALVAVGRNDLWSPVVQHEHIASLLPDARLRVIEGSGHMLPVEQPTGLSDVLTAWLGVEGIAA